MSQQEFEQNDQEVMDLVNKAAAPEAKAMAEEIAQEVEREAHPDVDDSEERYRKWCRKRAAGHCAVVAACILVAAAMVVVLAMPELLVWVANAFILSCGIVAALQIERIVRCLRH